jgi:hypothetical protein
LRKFGKFVLLILILALASPVLPAMAVGAPTAAPEDYAEPFYNPVPNGHPRLYFREADIPDIRERWENHYTGKNPPQVDWFITRMKNAQMNHTSGILPISTGSGSNANKEITFAFQTNALEYLMYRNTDRHEEAVAKGRLAIEMAKEYLTTFNWGPGLDLYSRNYEIGPVLVNTAAVYDWCYDLLTDADKAVFLDRYRYLANYFEENGADQGVRTVGSSVRSFPNSGIIDASMVNGHNVEEQFPALFAMALAVADEEPFFWDVMSNVVFNFYLPTQNALLQQSAHWQGNSYGPARYNHPARINYWATMMQDPGSRKSILNETATLGVVYSFLYNRRADGKLFQEGDMFVTSDMRGGLQSHGEQQSLMYVNALYGDPYIQTELNRLWQYKSQRILEVVEGFLLWSDVEPKPYAGNLPQWFYMPSPRGQMIAMTNWYDVNAPGVVSGARGVDLDSDAMMVSMKVGERFFSNHYHADSGSFQVYYKGTLATEAGVYESASSMGPYGSAGDHGWTKTTVSKNAMLIYDKDLYQKFDPIDGGPGFYFDRYYNQAWRNPGNHGGQRMPDGGNVAQNMILDEVGNVIPQYKFNDGTDPGYPSEQGWYSGKVISHGVQGNGAVLDPDYTYLKGDLAPLYTYRTEEYNRSFMFLNFKDETYPGALIVFDRVTTTDPDYEKIYLLHSVEKPIADYITDPVDIYRFNDTFKTPTAQNPNGQKTGYEQLIGGNEVIIQRTQAGAKPNDAYGGQMINTTLLPTVDNLQTKLVYGFNFPDGKVGWPTPNDRNSSEYPPYMLQISPKNPAKTDLMLNVMQVSDIGTEKLPVERIGDQNVDDFVGARIKAGGDMACDYAALFAAGGRIIDYEAFIPAIGDDDAAVHFVVADLAGGRNWTVTGSDGSSGTIYVDSETNVGEFYGAANVSYTLTPGNAGARPSSSVTEVAASASVEKLPGARNRLTVTVTEYHLNGLTQQYEETFLVQNNAAGTYAVGPYQVYVETKGNDQIRECRLVTEERTPALIGAEIQLDKLVLTFDAELEDAELDRSAFTVTGIRNNDWQNNRDPNNPEKGINPETGEPYTWGGGGWIWNSIGFASPSEPWPIENPQIVNAYVTLDKKHVVLDLQHSSTAYDIVKVSYSGEGGLGGPGGRAAAFTDAPVTNKNVVMYEAPPKVIKASAYGDRIFVYFDRLLYGYSMANGWGEKYQQALGIDLDNQPPASAFTVPGFTVEDAKVYGQLLVLTLDRTTSSADGALAVTYTAPETHYLTDGYDIFNNMYGVYPQNADHSKVPDGVWAVANLNVAQAPGIVKAMTRGFVTDGGGAMGEGIPQSLLAAGSDPTAPALTDIGIIFTFGNDVKAADDLTVTVNGIEFVEGEDYLIDKLPYTQNQGPSAAGMNAYGDLLILKKEALLRLPGKITEAVVEVTFNDPAGTVSVITIPYTDNRVGEE